MAEIKALLKQLEQISPMPEDALLTDELLSKYEDIVRKLAVLKDPVSISPLINSFGYGDGMGIYWTVLHVLEEFEIEQVDPILIAGLKTGDRGTKMWAAYMLGRSRNLNAVNDLADLLSDSNESVRRNAEMALGMIGRLS